jgi:uncharacterized membrane protein YkoI
VNRKFYLALILGLCALLGSAQLSARQPYSERQGRSNGQAENGLTLDGAVSRIREREGGRVLSADTEQDNGDKVYRIRVLTKEGKVKRLRIDARSGRTLPSSR